MMGNIGVRMVNDVMTDTPYIIIGPDQVKEDADILIQLWVLGVGPMNGIVPYIQSDHCGEKSSFSKLSKRQFCC